MISTDGSGSSNIKLDINGNQVAFGTFVGTAPIANLSSNFTVTTIPGETLVPTIFTGNGTFEFFNITGSIRNGSVLQNNQEIIFDNITITGSVKSQPKGFSSGSSIEAIFRWYRRITRII